MFPYLSFVAHIKMERETFHGWMSQRVNHSNMKWPEQSCELFSGESKDELTTIAELLTRVECKVRSWDYNSFLAVEMNGDLCVVMGVLVDGNVTRLHHSMVTMIAGAFELGGTGEAIFVYPDGKKAWSLSSEAPYALMEHSKKEIQELKDRYQAEFVLTDHWVEGQRDCSSLSSDEFMELHRRFCLDPIEESPRQQELIEALGRCLPELLWKAASDHRIMAADLSAPLVKIFPNAGSIHEGIRVADKHLRVSGIELLALVDPERAFPLAREMIEKDFDYIQDAAMAALGFIPTDAALDTILTATVRWGRFEAARCRAVARSTHPALVDRLLLLLSTHPVFLKSSYPVDFYEYDRSGNIDDQVQTSLYDSEEYLNLAVASGDQRLVPRLIELFFDPPFPPMAEHVADVLERMGGPLVDVIAGKLDSFQAGVGLALNQDDARRKELLGIDPNAPEPGDIMEFSGLRYENLSSLLKEKFINVPSWSAVPSLYSVLSFIEKWPEVTAHGHAVSQRSDRYMVMVEGLACRMKDVQEGRRVPLRQAFIEFCRGSEVFVVDKDELYAKWK